MRSGKGQPAWRSGLTANRWATIATAVLDDANPQDNADINPNGAGAAAPWYATGGSFASLTGSWSGGDFSEQHQCGAVTGEGHNDGASNAIFFCDFMMDDPAWGLLRWPTGAIGNTGTLDDSQEASGVYFDGRPRASHVYNFCQWVGDRFHRVCVGNGYKSAASASNRQFAFDLATRDYVELSGKSRSDTLGGVAYDHTRGDLFYFPRANQEIERYDLADDTWHVITGFVDWGSNYIFPIFDEAGDAVLVMHDDAVYYWDLPIVGSRQTLTTTGTAPTGRSRAGHCYDSTRDRYLAWEGGTGIITLTPPGASRMTGTWTYGTATLDGGNTVVPPAALANGTFNRFWYSKHLDCAILVNATTDPVYVFPFS